MGKLQYVKLQSAWTDIDYIPGVRPISILEAEPMLYSASPEFAEKHGGPLTREILHRLSGELAKDYHGYPVIDTRVHMLMKGFVAAIPGWHCDAVYRGAKFAQPDFSAINLAMPHFTCLLGSEMDIANTEFANQGETLTIPYRPQQVWGSIDTYLRHIEYKGQQIEQGYIYRFWQSTLHRAVPAVKPGWRMFFRLSFYHTPPQNKIRHQTQVYAPLTGW